MKHQPSTTLSMPGPRFAPGQFIRFTEYGEHEGFIIIARVFGIQANGYWHCEQGDDAECEVAYQDYVLVCQAGCHAVNGCRIMPGTVLIHDVAAMDAVAEPISYNGPVFGPSKAVA